MLVGSDLALLYAICNEQGKMRGKGRKDLRHLLRRNIVQHKRSTELILYNITNYNERYARLVKHQQRKT